MKKTLLAAALAASVLPVHAAVDAGPLSALGKVWTFQHSGQAAEIVAFDDVTSSLWVAGVSGVDVLDFASGSLIQHIDTREYGSINSVAIHNGIAAFALESSADRSSPGTVKLFDTVTRSLASGVNSFTVGALPDMVTFTPDGSRLLVANEGTPNFVEGVDTAYHAFDPVGSVSIIDMNTRSVVATAGFDNVPTSGSHIRTKATLGVDFEPEYIAVNAAGTTAYVTLQEANAIGVLDLRTNSFTQVIGLGVKDFNNAANAIDATDRPAGTIALQPVPVSGLYQPDGIAAYEAGGRTYLVMANEGDTREDEADKARISASGIAGTPAELARLNISTVDSSAGNLVTFGARSFSIRDEAGNIIFDSGNQLDAEAIARGIYDDGRSDDKGVEPEGVELLTMGGRTFAFIGLERTTKSAVAVYDVTDPATASFIDMIVTDGDIAPEGLKGFAANNMYYLAIANENSNTTSLYALAPVPEPESYAMLLAGLGLIGFMARRRLSA
ncbi:choice-of-anchor I family protein [Thauera sinica]|uniref:Choice-of-anchor I family protein n=1 Tax=Thauera sinica TaxID=2665146 RepID=A0ABW1ANH9_9RHOO|nr:choice-of-anchor I family protein [Thauera sp. K11]ATE62622.1 PEP-CTERM sorting domain-containing protein [Thauera sp. K11]